MGELQNSTFLSIQICFFRKCVCVVELEPTRDLSSEIVD